MSLEPKWPLRDATVQSMLASFKPRNWLRRGHPMNVTARECILDCGNGVRLQGFHSLQQASPKGLVILFHGWEGSHRSVYLVSMACKLYEAGYNVFRLNLRDHGGTHALNAGLFHSGRINEVLGAIEAIGRIDAARPQVIVGFSLGGNFALRVAIQGRDVGVAPDLSVGICPAIEPAAALRALDDGTQIVRGYFLKKWRRSMQAKASAWPHLYDFTDLMTQTSLVAATRRFAERYTEYGSLEDYLAAYTLTPAMISRSSARVAVLAAQDDPVVPFSSFMDMLDRGDQVLLSARYGGHCGFIENLWLRSWAEQQVMLLLKQMA